MKVLISVVGRFHAFDLAKQLQKHNLLYKINTTYPKHITAQWGIDKDKISSNIALELINRYVKRYVPKVLKKRINTFVNKRQAKSNIKLLKDVDIFIGWSGSSLEALIEAKKRGVITILERGSSHYSYQMDILTKEYKKHNKNFSPDYDTWKRELLEYELADYISISSIYVKRTFIEMGIPESKLLLNPYGVEITNFKQIPKTDATFRVVYAGGFTFQKGVEYLLKAFYELNLPNSELIHLGSVNNETQDLIERYKKDNIKFLGHQKQDELYKYYSQGSVFVMMSIQDGFGMVLPQAMACGLPIIATNNTGGPDLLTANGEEGYVINIRDVNALKEKLRYLYNNPEVCITMGQKAKTRVSQGFSWDDYGTRYFNNLKEVSK
ncbi:glycosyltransferase family 4 protein [Lacinutrix sp. MEBiC02595]